MAVSADNEQVAADVVCGGVQGEGVAMRDIGVFLLVLVWTAGVIIAEGWWKAAAFFFPPYGIYLAVEVAVRRWLLA